MKLAVIGGGSTYTPELVAGLLARAGALALRELWLMDVDPGRLEVVGRFAQRMVAARANPFEVILTTDRPAALRGAAYVVTQLRVGAMAARRADEYLGRRHGLIGQETTGVGGISKALRTIPVMLDIAREMQTLAPGALLVNFTNPSGLIIEALSRHAPAIASVGLCNGPITTQMAILAGLERAMGQALAPERSELDALGLNHLSWYRGFRLDGRHIWQEVLDGYLRRLRVESDPDFDPWIIELLQMIPNGYLTYYYRREHKVAEQAAWPPSRAEQVMQIEAALLQEYADPARSEPPPMLMQRGGAHYSTLATQVMLAHHKNLAERHIADVPHRGAVAGWPADWVLELPCRVDAAGVHPLPVEPLPPVCFGLLAAVKSAELLTVEAAVRGDHRALARALLVHPLGPPADRVQRVKDDLLITHREHLPRFWS